MPSDDRTYSFKASATLGERVREAMAQVCDAESEAFGRAALAANAGLWRDDD